MLHLTYLTLFAAAQSFKINWLSVLGGFA